ncbi:hypothetical protein BJV74DRAFT_616654 [Russula compacta]|nr:hypothetical protein BJV74DRAFT_616654 [Russula compacta]
MSLHNVNDPEGVKALLDTLRSSQAWTDAVESGLAAPQTTQPSAQGVQPSDSPLRAPAPGPGPRDAGTPSIRPFSIPRNPSSHSTLSVADLLSQLRASQSLEPTSNASEGDRAVERSLAPHDHHTNTTPTPQTTSTHASQPQQDLRTLSFQQALPHISRLMEDLHVVESLTKVSIFPYYHFPSTFSSKMKEEQDKLEKQLWEERENIRKRHEERVNVAKNKAKMIGVGLSEQDAQSMFDSFHTELRKFDAERVLPAWDNLVRGHQAHFEELNVPTMFVTNDTVDTQKQRKVVQVLEDILSTSDRAP